MIQPFFSIILPTFNRATFLAKAIESVLAQTFTEWELIIIDDGSTDGTKTLVENFSDSRIKYVWQENQERSVARNNGISISQGQYICFLDSDDYYLENHLQSFYEAIINQDKPIAFFYCNVQFLLSDGECSNLVYEEEFHGNLDFIIRTTIHSQQTCIHRDILQKHQFNKTFKIGEDIELWMHIFNKYPVFHIENYTIVVVHHNGRTVGVDNIYACKMMIPLYKHIFKKPNPGSKIPFRQKLLLYSTMYFVISRSFIVNNKKWSALIYLLYSLLYAPFIMESKHKVYLFYKLLFTKYYCEYYSKNEIVLF